MKEFNSMKVKFYGTRGTTPLSGSEFSVYGTATSCISVKAENTTVVIDAGTGLLRAARELEGEQEFSLLVSHPHIDHISALPVFAPAFTGKRVAVYGAVRAGLSVSEQIELIMREPLWPVGLECFSKNTLFKTVTSSFYIGVVNVSFIEGNHPGGVCIYKLTCSGKTAVFAVDYEHSPEYDKALCEFAKGADLLVYDAQYSEEEYPSHIGWGHSTPENGIRIAKAAGVKQIIFTHHGIFADDSTLAKREEEVKHLFENSSFAKADTEVLL